MHLKGILKEKSDRFQLGILFLIMILSVIVHILFAQICITLFTNIELNQVSMIQFTEKSVVDTAKFLQLFTSVGLFITPILIYAYLCQFDLKIKNLFSRQTILLVFAIMIMVNPFISYIYEWNMSFNLPDWMVLYEERAKYVTEYFLKMNNITDLIFNILILAAVPAIGEELLFRGYLQQKFCSWFANHHIAIIVSAFLFSAIHMQFHGFLPRFILGLLLGYFFYWSKSIWVPVIAHFINNTVAIIVFYPSLSNYNHLIENTINLKQASFSIIAVIFLVFLFYKSIEIKRK